MSSLAHPANFIYAKKYLDADVHYYKTHTVGTGPFTLKNYVRGSLIELERNPDYWRKGLPYLEGIKYFIIKDTSARAKAIRSARIRNYEPQPSHWMNRRFEDVWLAEK